MYVFRVDASDGCVETREQSDALVRAVGFHKRARWTTTTTTDGTQDGRPWVDRGPSWCITRRR